MLQLKSKMTTEERLKTRDIATETTDRIKYYNKMYYDKAHIIPSWYKIGDYVLVRDLQSKAGESEKFKPNYKGPYLVSKILNKNRYVITDIPGYNITAKSYNTVLSQDKTVDKKCIPAGLSR